MPEAKDDLKREKVRIVPISNAVWIERNYDFSVSNLSTTPGEVYQYEKISIMFRADSWDRNLPYDNIPVEVLLNGSVIYSTTVDFIKYGVQNFSFDINVGALLGQQTLVARVNWADHNNETRTTTLVMSRKPIMPEVSFKIRKSVSRG